MSELYVLLVLQILIVTKVSTHCGPKRYLDRETQLCTDCSKCAPGFRRLSHCKAHKDTTCKPCPLGKYSIDGQKCHRCRKKCPHGEEMVNQCNRTSDIECRPCGKGTFFSKYLKLCKRCSVCAMGYELKRGCQANKNTVCKPCKRNHFKDPKSGRCRKCTVCGAGYSVSQSCSFRGDAICKPCPERWYNSQPNKRYFCNPCTRCEPGREMLRQCNSTHDTVCGNCTAGYFELPLKNSSQCVRCSKCDDANDVTKIVDECRTMMNDPNMICLPEVVLRHQQFSNSSYEEYLGYELAEDYDYIKMVPYRKTKFDEYALVAVLSLFVCVLFIGVGFAYLIIKGYTKHVKQNRAQPCIIPWDYCVNDQGDDQDENQVDIVKSRTPDGVGDILSTENVTDGGGACQIDDSRQQELVLKWRHDCLGQKTVMKSSSAPFNVSDMTRSHCTRSPETTSLFAKNSNEFLTHVSFNESDNAYSDILSVSAAI